VSSEVYTDGGLILIFTEILGEIHLASHQFIRVEFTRFKAFKRFTLNLRSFNILVGPNNAGKSTILAAFRILAAAMRRASARKATRVKGPQGFVLGYEIDLSSISVAEENIFYNYDDDESASVVFHLSGVLPISPDRSASLI
jgi:predicted ATP-binding protein involved in virulence